VSFRVKASAAAFTAAACMLLAPTAMAASHGPIQVTGKQLKSALLPASDFPSGYTASGEHDSGRSLQHGGVYQLPSMSCKQFWLAAGIPGIAVGFGQTAYAGDLVGSNSDSVSVFEVFQQSVYQFASTHAASSFFSQLSAKYRLCPSLSESDTKGGTLHWTVRSRSTQHIGGHQALQLAETETDSSVAGVPTPIYVLYTINGTDVYTINTALVTGTSPQPAESSLILKLIARVSALR
jgi:PknH-like extracellular domain